MILFLGFVFCIRHWDVSPGASVSEISNPGQQCSFLRRVAAGRVIGERNCSQICDCFAVGHCCIVAREHQDASHHTTAAPTPTPTGMRPFPPHIQTYVSHNNPCHSLPCTHTHTHTHPSSYKHTHNTPLPVPTPTHTLPLRTVS